MKSLSCVVIAISFCTFSAASSETLLTLSEYEICGAAAISVASTLSIEADLTTVGVFLDVPDDDKEVLNRLIFSFVEVMPSEIAKRDSIDRSEISHRLRPMSDHMFAEAQQALNAVPRFGPSDYLEVFQRHTRLLVQCAGMAGLK